MKNTLRIGQALFASLLLTSLSLTSSFATTYYWVGGGLPANFNANTSWSTSLGGTMLGVAGTFVPTASDVFIFDGSNITSVIPTTGSVTVTVNGNYTVGSVRILNFSGANQVTIQGETTANRTLTIAPVSADVFTLAAGNTLNIVGNSVGPRTLGIVVGNLCTATLAGTVNVNLVSGTGTGSLSASGSGAITFANTGVYVHNVTAGTIPTATWSAGSECQIKGATGAMPSGTAQSFSNLTWSCAAQSANLNFDNNIPTAINGIFKITSTNASALVLRNSTANTTLTIGTLQIDGGTLVAHNSTGAQTVTLNTTNFIQNGGTFNANAGTSATSSVVLNVTGDWTQNNGTTNGSNNAGPATLAITGNLAQTGGTLNLSASTGAVAATVGGNLSQTAGTIDLSTTSATPASTLKVAGNVLQSTGSPVIKRTTGATTTCFLEMNGTVDRTLTTVAAGLGTGLNLNINKTGGAKVQLASAVSLPASNLALIAGALDLNGFTLTYATGLTINRSGGTLVNGGTQAYASNINVTYSGNQDIATGAELPAGSTALNNLTVSVGAANTVTLTANAQPNGNLTVNGGTLNLSTFTADRVAAGGTLLVSTNLIIGGTNTLPANYTTNTLTSSTVTYGGTTQSVRGGLSYNNLVIAGSGVKTLAANVSAVLTGNVTVSAGTLDLGANILTRSSNGGVFQVNTGAVLRIGGTTSAFPTTYNAVTLQAGSTVEYYGSNNTVSTQSVNAFSYSNLSVSGTATTQVANTLNVNGNFDVTGVYTQARATNVTGNLTISGTGKSYSTGSVGVLAITGNLNVGVGATFAIGNLNTTTHTVGGTATVDGSITYTNLQTQGLTISGNLLGAATGAINLATSSGVNVLTLSGADNSGYLGSLTAGNGTVNYNLASGTQSIFPASYNTLNVTGTTTTKQLLGNVSVAQAFTVGTGVTLNLNSKALTLANTLTINSGGTLNVNANAILNQNGASITNNGTLIVVGTNGNPATVTSTGTYTITQSAASTVFQAQYYVFDKLGTNGITISNGTIHATNNFSNGTFSNGTGAAYLTLTGLNFTDFTASNVVFNGSTTPTYNVVRTSGTGIITFDNASGSTSGYFYESDVPALGASTGLVRWTNAVTAGTYYWVGGTTAANWNANGVWSTTLGGAGIPGFTPGTSDVFIFDGSDISSTAGAQTGAVTVNVNNDYNVAGVSISNFAGANPVTLQAPTNASRTLTLAPTVANTFTVASGNVLNIAGNAGARNLAIAIGANTTATIDGTVSATTNSGVGSLAATGGSITFSATGSYVHAVNAGTIPTATWTTGSEVRILGATTTAPGGLGQTFSNFTWNATGQSAALVINTTISVPNTFKVSSTGSSNLSFRSSTAGTDVIGTLQMEGGTFNVNTSNNNNTLTVTNFNLVLGTVNVNTGTGLTNAFNVTTFTQTGGVLNLNTSSGATAFNVANFSQSGASTTVLTTSTGAGTLTVTGNLAQSGTSVLNLSSNATGIGIAYLAGNLSQANTSTIQNGGAVASRLEFNGASASTIAPVAGGFGTGLNVTVNKTATVQALGNLSLPNASNFILTSGTLDLNSNTLTFGNGVNITRSGGSMINGGSFAYGTTVNLTYTGNQNITTGQELPTAAAALNTFTVSVGAANTVTLSANVSPSGNVNVASGTLDLATFTANRFANTLTFTLGANTNLLIGGTNTFPANYTTYTLNATSTTHYKGTTQSVATLAYGNLTISGTGTKTLAGNISAVLTGNVLVSAGIFDIGDFLLTRSANGGTFTVSPNATLRIGGTKAFPATFNAVTLTGSTVEYYGTANTVSTQSVNAFSYNDLLVSGTATTQAANTLTVLGNFTVTGAYTQARATNVTGNVVTSGTATFNTGATGALAITGNLSVGVGTTFTIGTNNTIVHTVGGTATIDGALVFPAASTQTLTISGNLIGAATGTITLGTGTNVLNLGGASNGGYLGVLSPGTTSTISYNRAGDQTVLGVAYNTLTFGTGIKTLLGNTTVAQNFTVPANATLALNGFNFGATGTTTVSALGVVTIPSSSIYTATGATTLNGAMSVAGTGATLTSAANVTIAAGGSLTIGANATFNMNGATIANSGIFSVAGSAGNVATVTRTVAGNYVITQAAATGDFGAKYYVFDKSGGITLSLGTINATNNLSEGAFTNGAGAASLTLSGLVFADFTASNVVFNNGPTKNVVRTSGTGAVTFLNYSGALGGQAFETDNNVPGIYINWGIGGSVYYSRATAGFYAASTWNTARDGSGSAPSLAKLTDASSDFIIQAGHTVTVDNDLNIKNLTVETSGALVIGNNTTARNLTINGNVLVAANASLTVGNNNAVHNFNFFGSTITNNGTFSLYNTSLIKSANANLNGIAMTIGGTNSPQFATVGVNNQNPPYTFCTLTAGVGLNIRGSVNLAQNASFVDGGFSHQVGGNWATFAANQLTATGTMLFNGTSNQNISATTFNNLTINNASTAGITGAVTVNGAFLVSGSQVTASAGAQTFNGDFAVASGSSYTHSVLVSNFNGSGTQNIDFANATFQGVAFGGTPGAIKATTNNLNALAGATINAGVTVNGSGTHSITGALTINGTCNWDGIVIMRGGNLTSANATINLPAELTTTGAVTLVNSVAANPIALTLGNNFNINGNTFTVAAPATIAGLGTAGLNVAAGATITLLGANNFPTGFGTVTFAVNSNARYTGAVANQTIASGFAYSNLLLQNNTKDAAGNLTIARDLDFLNTGVATTLNLGAFAHTVGRNIANANVSSIISAAGGSLTFNNPNTAQSISVGNYNIETVAFTLDAPTASVTKSIANGANLATKHFITTNLGGGPTVRLFVDLGTNTLIGGATSTFALGKHTTLNTSGTTSLFNTFDPLNANAFATITLDDSSAVHYNGGANQTIANFTGLTYGTLQFSGNSTKTALSALNINGNVVASANTPVFLDGGFTHKVAGDWTLGANNYSRATGSTGTIELDGLNQAVYGSLINLICSNGGTKTLTVNNLTIDGDLLINTGVAMDANIRNITFRGNWSQLGTGSFAQSTGTTTFSGISASPQTISIDNPSGSLFGNLTISRGAGATPSANIQVTTNSNVYIGGTLRLMNYNNYPTCDIITSFADLNIAGDSLFVGGTIVIYPTTTMTTTGSTLAMNGDQAQIFYLGNSAVQFNNLLFSGTGAKQFANWSVNNVGACGTWYNPYIVNGDFKIDLATLSASNLPITVNGNWFNTGDFQHANVVTLNGVGKTISNTNFYSVVINSGDRTLTGDLTVDLDLTIANGASLDVSASNFSINLVRNYVNSGVFNARQGTVNITASGNTTLNTGGIGATKQFYNLNINNSACGNTTTLGDSLKVVNDLTINSGVLASSNYNVHVGRSFYNYDQYTQGGTSMLAFDPVATGTRSFVCTTATAFCGTSVSTYRRVKVDVGTAKLVQSGSFTLNADLLIIASGYYKLNANTIDFSNSASSGVAIYPGATLDVDSGASLLVRNTITNNGTFRLVGTSAVPANLGTCTSCGTSSFTLLQNSASALLQARYYQVDSRGTSTTNYVIDLQNGAIDPILNLSNGTFSSATTTGSTSAYIRFGAAVPSSDIVIKGLVLNTGKPRSIEKITGTNTVTLQNATGALQGAAFETDVPANGATTGFVRWSYLGAKFWDGNGSAANTSWNTAANWNPDGVPTASDTVYLDNTYFPASSYTVNIDVADTARVAKLIMQRIGALNITLNVLTKSLKSSTDVIVSNGCTLNGGSGSIYVKGNWSNGGTFTGGTSKVYFKGTGSGYSITAGASAFNDVFLQGTTGSNYSLGSAFSVNNLTINASNTLDVSSLASNVTVGGDWVNNGIFNPRQGTVSTITFNKAGAQSILNGPFNHFALAGSGTKTFQSSMTIYGNVTIGNGTRLDAQTYNMYVRGNWINNAATSFTQDPSATVYFNGVNQTIDNGTTPTTFNNVTLLGTGTKTLAKNSSVSGDFLISPAGLTFNMQDYQLVGNNTTSQFIISSNSTVLVGGSGTFLNGFANTNLASNSTIRYQAFSATYDNQTIMSLPNSTAYGNLDLRVRNSGPTPSNKTLSGNLYVAGNLTINDVSTQLNVNNYTINLTGNLAFPSGGLQINWGTAGGAGTLVHDGTATYNWQTTWNIDPDLTSFNNLILAGSQRKNLQSNIALTGNLTVQGNVLFDMNTYTVTGAPAKAVLLQNASVLESAVGVPDFAFPTGFGTYSIDQGATVYLDANDAQNVFTTPVYGNLVFNQTNTSTPLRDITLIGGQLVVANDLSLTNTELFDGGFNITVGGDFNTNDSYAPTSKLILNGDNQLVRNLQNNASVINLKKLTVTGTGTKTIGTNVTVNITDSLFVDTNLVLSTTRPVVYSGTSWNNQGAYTTSNTTTFNNPGKVYVDPGPSDPANAFATVNFNTGDTLFFRTHGGDFNGAFNINAGVVSMGNRLTHTLAGAILVTPVDGWVTNRANLTFDGANQTIPGALTARNVICANAGTKTMQAQWHVANLTINTGVTLNASTVDTIFVEDNWLNNGTFTANTITARFIANGGQRTIAAGNSSFYNLSLKPTSPTTYKLTSPTTRVSREIDLLVPSKLKLNGQTLIHGNTGIGAGKTLLVEAGATLEVDTAAYLLFDNRTSIATATIDGTLRLIGTASSVANISRSNTGGQSITVNGTLAANYYQMEYLSAAGLTLGASATIDAVNNLSNGTFSNLNAAAGSTYITSSMTSTPTAITNVVFNYSGAPVVGAQYNIKHSGPSTITFVSPIGGALACPAYKTGNVVLPNCSNANWIGAIDFDWNKGGNWSTGVVPDSITDAFIPIPAVPNQSNLPIISTTSAQCRNLTIQSGSVTLVSGAALKVAGDVYIGTTASGSLAMTDATNTIRVKGNWTRNLGSFSAGAIGNVGVVDFYSAGSVTINNRTTPMGSVKFSGAGTYTLAGGNTINSVANSFAVNGNVTLASGVLTPSAGSLFVRGNFTRTGGTYSAIGTVDFNGTGTQTITGATFNNLLLSGTSIRNTVGAVAIAGTTTMAAGGLAAQPASVISMAGNVNFATGTTFDDGGSTHIFTGATWSSLSTIVGLGNGDVQFNGGNQTITTSNMSGLIFAGTGTKTVAGDLTLVGDLFIGNVTVNLQTYLISGVAGTPSMQMAPGAILNVLGTNNFPTGFSPYSLDCGSTVNYTAASINQTIAAVDYGNLTVSNGYPTFNKLAAGSFSICNNFTISANTTFDVTNANYDIAVGGNFNNASANGSFLCRNAVFKLNGTGNQTINIGTSGISGSKGFYRMLVDKASGTASFSNTNTMRINDDLEVNNGALSLATADTVYVGGNFKVINGSIVNNASNLVLKRVVGASLVIQSNGSPLSNVQINSPGSTYTLQDNMTITRNFDILNGTVDAQGKSVMLGDGNARTSNIAGAYKIGAGGYLRLANNYTFNIAPTGAFELVGAVGNIASVTSTGVGARYNFNVNGRIKANYYLFEYMRSSGVNLSATAVIDPRPYNLSNGTFTNGTSGGVYLRIENNQYSTPAGSIDTIVNVNFANNPGGGARNVVKTVSNTGKLVFHNASGVFAGPTFENDPYNNIDWTGNYTLYWTGTVNTDWYNPSNWTPAFVPTAADNAIIQIATNQPLISDVKPTGIATCKNLTINVGAELTLKTTDAQPDMAIVQDILIDGVLKLTNSADTILVSGNWSRGGSASVSPGNGTVVLNANSGLISINNRTSAFGNLMLNGNAVFQLGANTIVNKTLKINLGTLDVNSANNYSLRVGENWINTGVFQSRAGTVTLAGNCASTNVLRPGLTSAFNNLTISPCSSAVYNLTANDMSVRGTFTLNAGTFNANSLGVNNGDGVGADVLSIYGNFKLNNTSTLRMGAGSSVSVLSGGVFSMVGTDSLNPASIVLQSGGTYGFTVNSGATISAQYYSVSGINTSGIVVRSGASVNAVNNFSHGAFLNGAASGTYLTLENNYSPAPATCDTIRFVSFGSGPSKNATRITGSGCVCFKDGSGAIAGYFNEKDELAPSSTAGLLRWAYTNPQLYWTGAAGDNDWFNVANWNDPNNGGLRIPDVLTNVIIPNGLNASIYPEIKSPNAACTPTCPTMANAKDISLKYGSSLTLKNNMHLTMAGDLLVTGATLTVAPGSASTLTVGRSVTITNSTSPARAFTVNANSAVINVGKDWSVYPLGAAVPAYNAGTSTLNMNAAGTVDFIQTVGSLYNVNFNNNASVYRIPTAQAGAITVANNISIATGVTLTNQLAGRVLNVGGNWTNNGTFTHGSGTVNFNGTGTQTIGGTTQTAFNVVIMNGGTKTLGNNISAAGNFTVGSTTATTLNLGGKDLTFTGTSFAIQNNSSSLIHGGAGSIIFTSNSNQDVSVAGTVPSVNKSFYKLTKNGTGILKFLSNIDVDNNFTINAGMVDANAKSLFVGGNWSDLGTFAANTGLVVFDGAIQTIARAGGESFHNLKNEATTSLTLSNNVSVTGNINLTNAKLFTGSNALTMSNASGTVARTTGYVDGFLVKTYNSAAAKVFEVGANGVYLPVTVTPTASASGTVVVAAFDGDHPFLNTSCVNSARSVNRYWRISKAFAQTVNVTFVYTAGVTDPGVAVANLGLSVYNGSWTSLAVVPTPTATSLTANNISVMGAFQIAETSGSYRWTGATNNNWSVASNWCGTLVPTASNDAVINVPYVNAPIVPASYTAICRNLSVASGTTLSLAAATSKLQVHGDWANAGTFTPATGTVEFTGTAAQQLTNTSVGAMESFYHLTVNKAAGTLTVASNAEVLAGATMSVQAGTVDVASGKKVILRSAAPNAQVDNTARLGRVIGTITPTSQFTVERYIGSPATRLPYANVTNPAPTVFLASPVKGATIGQWTDDIQSIFSTSSSTLAYYSELNGTGATLQDKVNRGWRYATSNAETIPLGKGYKVFAGLDNSNDNVSVSGPVQTGTIGLAVTYTAAATQGWNLVGNPYACEIDWNAVYNLGTNNQVVEPNLYIMDPLNSSKGNSVYYVYQASTGISVEPRSSTGRSNSNGMYIASSQAFFVKALKNGTLAFSETVKPLAPFSAVYGNFRQEDEGQILRLQVGDGAVLAQAVVHFKEGATNGYEAATDADHLSNGQINIYTKSAGHNLAINGLGYLPSEVPVVIETKTTGTKTITIPEMTVTRNCYLHDKYLDKYTKLEEGTTYAYEVSADTASKSVKRFVLVGKPGPIVTAVETSEATEGFALDKQLVIQPNPYNRGTLVLQVATTSAESRVEVLDVKGSLLFVQTTVASEGQVKVDLSDAGLAAGVYTVRCISGSRAQVGRLVVTK